MGEKNARTATPIKDCNEELYSDKYITVTRSTLVIKKYWFPTFASRTLDVSDLVQVWRGTDPEMRLDLFRKKSWGMAFSKVWWALRNGREFDIDDKHNLAVRTLDGGMFGFSVERPDEAYEAITKPSHPLELDQT